MRNLFLLLSLSLHLVQVCGQKFARNGLRRRPEGGRRGRKPDRSRRAGRNINAGLPRQGRQISDTALKTCDNILKENNVACEWKLAMESYVELRGYKIYYYVWTANSTQPPLYPPIVAVNGGPGLSHDYMINIKALVCKGFSKVIFYDQLGTGKSTVCPNPKPSPNRNDCKIPGPAEHIFDLDYYVLELEAVIQANRPEPTFHLYAHSFGTIHAIKFAAKNWAALGKVVLGGVLGNSKVYIDAMWDNRTGIMGILPAIMKKKYKQFEEAMAWADPVFGKINEIALNHQYSCRTFPAPDCIANYLDNWNAEVYGRLWGPSEYFMQSNETGDLDLTQELNAIDKPVLLMHGKYDSMRPKNIQWVADRLVRHEYMCQTILPRAGHMAMVDEPEKVVKKIFHFLTTEGYPCPGPN